MKITRMNLPITIRLATGLLLIAMVAAPTRADDDKDITADRVERDRVERDRLDVEKDADNEGEDEDDEASWERTIPTTSDSTHKKGRCPKWWAVDL